MVLPSTCAPQVTSGAAKGKTAVQLAVDQGNVNCVCTLLAVGARGTPMPHLIGTAIANAAKRNPQPRRQDVVVNTEFCRTG